MELLFVCLFFYRFVAISDLYEPTDDGTESQVRQFFLNNIVNYKKLLPEKNFIYMMLIASMLAQWLYRW